jgi:hypothetical protein
MLKINEDQIVQSAEGMEFKKVKVHYANMSISDLNIPYLCQIVEPIRMSPEIHTVNISRLMENGHTMEGFIQEHFRNKLVDIGVKVGEIELVECDYLVPQKLT